MFNADENGGRNALRILGMIFCGFGIIMLLGAITGFLSVHMAEGGGPTNRMLFASHAALNLAFSDRKP